jgi:peptidoglycan/LPS O-acetylase OafA/YrhL
MKPKDGLMVGTGLLAILLGAMPLNGYLGYMRDPTFFHQDAFIGSVWHLPAGVVPFGAGILLLALSTASTKQTFLIPLCSLSGGLVLSLPSIITANDHHAWLAWLSIVAIGWALAVLIHLTRRAWHNQPLNPSGNGGRASG